MASEKSNVAAEMGEQSLVYHNDGKYHQLKLKLFGTFLITTVLVAGFVCVVYIQSTAFQQLNTQIVKTLGEDDTDLYKVVEEDEQELEAFVTPPNPRIYFFEDYIEDVKIYVDLDRDLTIIKNITSGDCFLTKNENVPLVSSNGKINEDLRLDIVKIDDTEAVGKAGVLQYDEKEIIPPGYLTATIHEAADKMCSGYDSFWADKNENGKFAISRNRRQVYLRPVGIQPYCCVQTYKCNCDASGVYFQWCVETVCPCQLIPDECRTYKE